MQTDLLPLRPWWDGLQNLSCFTELQKAISLALWILG